MQPLILPNLKKRNLWVKGALLKSINDCYESLKLVILYSLSLSDKISPKKLQYVFAMLNQLHGVSRSGASSKQGGEEEEKLKNKVDRKDNEASRSGKGKDKVDSEEDIDENAKMT